MKTFLVIGIGRFGKHLATRLTELGNEVMIVDRDEDNIRDLLPVVTRAQIGDCMDENLLRSLGVSNFDVCFVCIGDNFQASLEISSLLKDLGAKLVVSKADRSIHEKFLLRNGADQVIHPERDAALRAAKRFSFSNVFDYIDLADNYSIIESGIPASWTGKTVRELDVRSNYNINIIAIKTDGHVIPLTDPDYTFGHNDHLIFAGNADDCARVLKMR